MKKIFICLLILLMLSGCSSKKEAIYIASDLETHYEELDTLMEYVNQDAKTQGYSIKYAFINGDNQTGEDIPYSLKDVSTYISKGIDGLNFNNVNYIFGSHDSAADTTGTNGFLYGGYEYDNFYVYAIDFYEMTEVDEAYEGINNFEEWLDTIETGKPILIFSHVPMHERRGDNHGASLWFDAINDAANDYDILFFWGHNHTNETSLDDGIDFIRPGDCLKIEGKEEESEFNFYYINDGCIIQGVSVVLVFNGDGTITYRPVYIEKNGFDENIAETIELTH